MPIQSHLHPTVGLSLCVCASVWGVVCVEALCVSLRVSASVFGGGGGGMRAMESKYIRSRVKSPVYN